MTTYSYVDKGGAVQNVDANSPDEAIANAPNRATDSGVIAPPLKSGSTNITESPTTSTVPTATRTGPAPRLDPNSITGGVGTFGDYENSKELSGDEANKIADRYTQQLQAEMDVINSQFNGQKTNQDDANTKAIARTKVLNSNTGLIDSGTGNTALGTTEKKAKDASDAIEADRSAHLQAAIGQIDQLKVDALDAAAKSKSADLTDYNNLREKNATKAQDVIKNYVAAGGSIEKLKQDVDANGKSSYDSLAAIVGGAGALDAIGIANAPKDTYVSDKPEILGNKAIFFKKDPLTGQISQQALDLPASSKEVKTVTRVPGEGTYVFYTDGTHEILGGGGTSGSGSSSGKGAPAPDIVTKINDKLLSYKGEDQYIDPYKYQDAYNAWVADGYDRAAFFKNFPAKQFINPDDNKILPAYLQTTAKSTTDITNPFQ